MLHSYNKNEYLSTELMSTKCPICGVSPVLDDTCPATCGSLEGLLLSDVDRSSSRTFGFDWANGFVAPFLGIDYHTAMDALMAARVSEGDNVVDLGCGDGRICAAACSIGADATGYDLDEILITKAKLLANEMDVSIEKKPRFELKDLFEVELNEYSVICMFLLPAAMDRLVPTLLVELTKGSRIISFGWQVPGLGKPSACCRGKADSTATERWFLYAWED